MAINLTDFDKIWASSSPLTPYSFSDANYEEGWNFVGSTPPARQMWDGYMKWSDEKQQYIVQNFLPLSGGTMTGSIAFSSGNVKRETDDSGLALYGGSAFGSGAVLQAFGKDNSTYAGWFSLRADDGVNNKLLVGKPDGTLTWDGNDITPQTLTTENMEDINVPSGTVTNLGTISLTKGTWIIHFLASFSSNSSGYRRIGIGTSTSSIGFGRFWYIASPPANGNETRLSLTTFATVSVNTTYYCNVHQTSGSTLTCGGGAQILRVSPLV